MQVPECSLVAIAMEGLLVEHVFAEAGTDALEVGDVVRQLLDGFHLLSEEVALNPVCHLAIAMVLGHLVEVQQRLVHILLQAQSNLHGFQASAELITVWTLDVRQNNASTTLVLELHQLLSMLSFFLTGLFEELVESTKSNIIPVKVIGHRLVNIAGVQLQVDLLVDA